MKESIAVLQNLNRAMLMSVVFVLGQSRFKLKVWQHPKLVPTYFWAAIRPCRLKTVVLSVPWLFNDDALSCRRHVTSRILIDQLSLGIVMIYFNLIFLTVIL